MKIATTHEVTVNLPQLADLLAVLGGVSIPATLSELRRMMATFDEKMDKLKATVDEFNARELAEDADHALSKAEVTRLTKELADLQAERDAGTLTAAQEARVDEIIAEIAASSNVPDEVLPEDAGEAT
jgi:peptidoglycan hydrolase CwlO-like protein